MITYRVTLKNTSNWELMLFVPSNNHLQPSELAQKLANADPQHSKYGPWIVFNTERNT